MKLEDIIAKAIKKISGKKENELCKYLPVKTGGYIHHFTFRKMKLKQAQELGSMIERFIVQAEKPIIVAPKQRAPRGSRKRRDHMNFTRMQLERLLNIARMAGDREIVNVLSPKKSLAAAKRELIQSVRHNKVEQDLWTNYVEVANAHQIVASMEPAATAK